MAPPDLSLSSDKDKVLFHTGAHKSNPINSEDESLEGRKVPPQNSDQWGEFEQQVCIVRRPDQARTGKSQTNAGDSVNP